MCNYSYVYLCGLAIVRLAAYFCVFVSAAHRYTDLNAKKISIELNKIKSLIGRYDLQVLQ
jgi:hypothetical protein